MNASPVLPSSSPNSPRPARMNPWNWVLLVAGVILSAVGLGLLIGGAILLGTATAQQDGQYFSSDSERYQSTGHAILGPPLVLHTDNAEPFELRLNEIASFRVRMSPVIPDQAVFIGVGDASDVAAYLEDVPHAVLGGMSWSDDGRLSGQWSWTSDREDGLREIAGAQPPAAPEDQDFWAESATGTGTQELTFDLQQGDWVLVVMNADGTRPVWVDLEAGARTDLLDPIGPGLLFAGLIGLVVGIPLLLLGAAGLGRNIDQPPAAPDAGPPGTVPASVESFGAYPLAFAGHLDDRLSRWLWLVKWLLAIPHYIILALLSFALLFTTIAAGIVILFTGRYPRSLFVFSVGVLRWSWRVGFYGYQALGTDRYPPFTLAPMDYPAKLTMPYPQRLSRGLVLVKWWLLVLPHILILSVLAGSASLFSTGAIRSTTVWSFSLLGLLLIIAAIGLLFTGAYLPGVFHLVVGVNRWAYRVSTYVLLLRDEYPPFRLDQGSTDPPAQALLEETTPPGR